MILLKRCVVKNTALFVCPACKHTRQFERNLRRLTGGKAIRSQERCRQRQGLKEGIVSAVNIALVNRFWHTAGVRLQKVPKPKIRIRLYVITDELQHRVVCLTGEAFTIVHVLCRCTGLSRNKPKRQGFVRMVEVADESVVVIKSVPKKP
jgi:hypothetical protein